MPYAIAVAYITMSAVHNFCDLRHQWRNHVMHDAVEIHCTEDFPIYRIVEHEALATAYT